MNCPPQHNLARIKLRYVAMLQQNDDLAISSRLNLKYLLMLPVSLLSNEALQSVPMLGLMIRWPLNELMQNMPKSNGPHSFTNALYHAMRLCSVMSMVRWPLKELMQNVWKSIGFTCMLFHRLMDFSAIRYLARFIRHFASIEGFWSLPVLIIRRQWVNAVINQAQTSRFRNFGVFRPNPIRCWMVVCLHKFHTPHPLDMTLVSDDPTWLPFISGARLINYCVGW